MRGRQRHVNSQHHQDNVRSVSSKMQTEEADVEERAARREIEISGEREMERERRRLADTKIKIEQEVKEQTELLRLLRSRRHKIAAQGEKLRRSHSPRKPPATPDSGFTTSGSKTPPPSRPHSPSAARKACNEAYDRMSPLEEHLAREQMHQDGIRSRDTRQERDERRWWEKYQKGAWPDAPSPETSPRTSRGENAPRNTSRSCRLGERETKKIDKKDKHHDSERQRIHEAWQEYDTLWSSWTKSPPSCVQLGDIPWPVLSVFLQTPPPTVDFTAEFEKSLSPTEISNFLFSVFHSHDKSRKTRLQGALLRYHPDHFESRFLERISQKHGERDRVREAVGIVVRNLMKLLNAEK